jgi:hypothetical protein
VPKSLDETLEFSPPLVILLEELLLFNTAFLACALAVDGTVAALEFPR